MSASFSAPTSILESLAARLGRAPQAIQELKEVLAEEARTLVVEGFEAQRAPSGEPWAPLRTRSGQILSVTRRYMNSHTARPTGDGIEVGSNFIGARVHNQGAVIKPKGAKSLAFPLATGVQVFGARGQVLQRPRTLKAMVYAKSVTIPARPSVPQGDDPGPIWGPRLLDATEEFVTGWLQH